MRAFIAVDMNEEVRGNFSRLQERLRRSGADVKWVRPENAHLTLKFMAEISDMDAESIKQYLDDIALETKPFLISLKGTGFFPDMRRPRVIWIGISRGVQELRDLAARIDERVAALGIPKEKRPFSPHLTLGRFRSNRNLDDLMNAVQKDKDFEAGEFKAGEVHLIKSELSQKGPTYTKLVTSTFSGE